MSGFSLIPTAAPRQRRDTLIDYFLALPSGERTTKVEIIDALGFTPEQVTEALFHARQALALGTTQQQIITHGYSEYELSTDAVAVRDYNVKVLRRVLTEAYSGLAVAKSQVKHGNPKMRKFYKSLVKGQERLIEDIDDVLEEMTSNQP